MADHDDELAEAVRELTRTIDDLRQELESADGRGRLRPPAPRPPTPRDLLRFTNEFAIPAAITVLKTSVRALEGFQRALELARTEREVRDRTSAATAGASERATELQRTTLSRLDTVLAELQRAASDGRLPADEQARDLLSQARTLRDDVDSRLREATADRETRASADSDADRSPDSGPGSTDAIRIDIEDGGLDDPDSDDEPESGVDVDAELETLKDQYGADEDENDDVADDSDSDSSATDGDDRDGPSEDSDSGASGGDAGADDSSDTDSAGSDSDT